MTNPVLALCSRAHAPCAPLLPQPPHLSVRFLVRRFIFITSAFVRLVSHRPALENATTTASVFLGEHDHLLPGAVQVQRQAAAVAGHTAFSDPRSELTCNNNNYDATCWSVVPRKRARIGGAVGAGLNLIMEGHWHRPLLPVPQAYAAGGGEDAQGSSRVLCSGAASTSGRPAAAGTAAVSQSQHGILAHLYRHSVEVDALVRIEVRCVRWLLLGDERTRL